MELEREKKPVNGLGIASLVFGIVGILSICGCGIGFIFGLIGTILGILGLTVLKRSGKGFPIAGLIVSGIALVFGSVWIYFYIPKHSSKDTYDYASSSTSNITSSTNVATTGASKDESNNSTSHSSSSNSSSTYSGSNHSSSYSSSSDLQADKEALDDSWNDLKDTVKDAFWEGVLNGITEAVEESSTDNNSSSGNPSSSGGIDLNTSSSKVSPEIKEFCDSYEAFMDQYYEVYKVIQSDDASTSDVFYEYADYLEKMADFEEKANYYYEHENEMSEADEAYFTACMLRIDAKMLKFMGDLD